MCLNVAETPKKQAKTAHIDHFRGPTKMMAATGRLKDGKTPFEQPFLCPENGLRDGIFYLKNGFGVPNGVPNGVPKLEKKRAELTHIIHKNETS